MPKRIIEKGNIHHSDYLRVLVTDTMPGDIPIVVSNDGFYLNMKSISSGDQNRRQFVEKLLSADRPYTIPYRYNILKSDGSPRRLSLTHPSSQMATVEFYKQYENLICYYCRKSSFSVRSPEKVGSLFFVRGSNAERNKVKGASIDTVDIENAVSNPASYFSYRGYKRAYEFFSSDDYVRLEKRYTVMHFADISKCFNSIYTHTLFWAVSDVQTAKDNTSVVGFSNAFDRLMQSMNFNETNGICVGAEVSRIFAEIILSEVDEKISAKLASRDLIARVHYEFRRYVDDYYIFCDNEKTSKAVLAAIRSCLSDFNLHLNEEKTVKVARPFITQKSKMIREASAHLEQFFTLFIDRDHEKGRLYYFPKNIRRPNALLRSLLESIKSSCFDHDAGYEATSNYIIGALASRVSSLVDGAADGLSREEVTEEHYIKSIMLLLEAIYFFYNVNPTVPSSLRVAQAAIQAAGFFSDKIPDRVPFLGEQIVRWTFQFVRSLAGSTAHAESESVPLEALNILLVLGQVGREDALAQKAILEFCGSVKTLTYFEIVSFLFCMQDDPVFSPFREQVMLRVREIVLSEAGVRTDSQAAHLALDILSCPFIESGVRAQLFNDLRKRLGFGKLSALTAEAAIKAFERDPWFVNWRETDLLRLIRKKELSGVY
jgi:hypothetical protein